MQCPCPVAALYVAASDGAVYCAVIELSDAYAMLLHVLLPLNAMLLILPLLTRFPYDRFWCSFCGCCYLVYVCAGPIQTAAVSS